MLRRMFTVAVISIMWALATAPSAHSAASSVTVRASARPKVCVTVTDNGRVQALAVRANIPWTVVASEASEDGSTVVETFEGDHTSNSGRVLLLRDRLYGFTVLAEP